MAERLFRAHSGFRALLAFAAFAAAFTFIATFTALAHDITEQEKTMAEHPYSGMWVTEDNHIRHELLPNGRYVEARGTREKAYEGRYWVTGDHIDYKDDTGFTADGDFRDGVLYHAGMVLRRR
ncbi:Atu4866 domain-containing protein [Neorhizobium sp. BETTINA12A]|uniref:Atu4866 domain-containing protein n=1 Tax=Neorhizobium sp. BETTINA12A TaxID=2908924 RepID=UPI001FF228C7|nr:Atu4866 domain-containing protein [Neorhizobium sp. BETTINA12A]MCJ9752625.1 Atu4866 domain-containing protein [Neorhizobium sp. BETTINA12A]